MNTKQFEYILPEERIAHTPVSPRDHAKMMVLDRNSGKIGHKHFYDLTTFLTSNDVIVLNNTKVFPARLFGKKETGGNIEVLLLKEIGSNTWQVMGRSLPAIGKKIYFEHEEAVVLKKTDEETLIQFEGTYEELLPFIEANGAMPLPPYIKSALTEKQLRSEYQTVYAQQAGSVAAPTAGLHLTEDLIHKLKTKGVQIEYVTLHVGAGTFLPIKVDTLDEHKMHSEHFTVEAEVADRLNNAKKEGKRIIAVGTTTTRVLESIADEHGCLETERLSGETAIFIYPPYKFKFVDSLITNFHLPHSTLLALVSALVSEPNAVNPFSSFERSTVGNAYLEAITHNYRFYSFGDGMFIQ